jgi:hypothetical protein
MAAAPIKIWDILDRPCGKRLHPYLPEFVAVLERTHELVLDAQTKGLLLQMSRATIDRLLREPRQRPHRRTRGTTKPGSLLKNSIPVRVYTPWDEQLPGFVEVDLVADTPMVRFSDEARRASARSPHDLFTISLNDCTACADNGARPRIASHSAPQTTT